MATKIIHKKSSTASSVPASGDIEPGEIALNLADKKIYTKTTGGTVIELADGDKLAGIESGATADQTASEILTKIKTVDGSGSGLDADLLDDLQGSYYLNYNNFTNTPTIPAEYTNSDVDAHLNTSTATTGQLLSWNGSDYDWTTVTGGGGDAATLDGLDSTQFLRSDTSDTFTGTLSMNGNIDFQGTSRIMYLSDSPLIDLATSDSGKYVALRYGGSRVVETTSSGLYFNQYGATIRGLYGLDIGGYNNQVGLSAEYDDGTQNVFGTLQYSGSTKLSATNTGVDVTGNIAVSGTVDGRDVAADGTKLDGIEAGADVTDAGNVNPLVDSHLNLSFAGTNYVLSWSGSDYDWTQALTASSAFTKTSGNVYFNDNVKLYFGTNGDLGIYHDGANSYINDTGTGGLILKTSAFSLTNQFGGSIISLDQYGAGSWKYEGSNAISVNSAGTTIDWGNLQVNGNIGVTGTVDGRDVASDGSKLDGIESGADVTDSGNVNPLVDTHLNLSAAGTDYVLSWNGQDYEWVVAGGGATGGGSDEIFWENDQTVTTNYTITNGKNAMSAGPITINAQITVTVGDGETWTVV